jgi:hypothetical protein
MFGTVSANYMPNFVAEYSGKLRLRRQARQQGCGDEYLSSR